jgi:hypothetical protein
LSFWTWLHLTWFLPIPSIYLESCGFILCYVWIKFQYSFLIYSSVVGNLESFL